MPHCPLIKMLGSMVSHSLDCKQGFNYLFLVSMSFYFDGYIDIDIHLSFLESLFRQAVGFLIVCIYFCHCIVRHEKLILADYNIVNGLFSVLSLSSFKSNAQLD